MQIKFEDVNLINRRWRTRNTDRITLTHLTRELPPPIVSFAADSSLCTLGLRFWPHVFGALKMLVFTKINKEGDKYVSYTCWKACYKSSYTIYATTWLSFGIYDSGLGENQRLVIDEPVEFEKEPPVEAGNFRRITDHSRGIYTRIYLKWYKATPEDVNM